MKLFIVAGISLILVQQPRKCFVSGTGDETQGSGTAGMTGLRDSRQVRDREAEGGCRKRERRVCTLHIARRPRSCKYRPRPPLPLSYREEGPPVQLQSESV